MVREDLKLKKEALKAMLPECFTDSIEMYRTAGRPAATGAAGVKAQAWEDFGEDTERPEDGLTKCLAPQEGKVRSCTFSVIHMQRRVQLYWGYYRTITRSFGGTP